MNTRDVLDYGCGKQTLRAKLAYVRGYDPCIDGLDERPEPADLVVCTDVLEHIEPGCLDAVLDDLMRVTKRQLFAAIETRAALKILSDGRNAHLIQEPPEWWLPKFFKRFHVNTFSDMGGEFIVVASTLSA